MAQTCVSRVGILKTLTDLVKVSRPVFWPVLPLVFSMGLLYGQYGITHPGFRAFPASLFGYGINDLYDGHSDILNTRKGSLEGVRLLNEQKGSVLKAICFSAFLLLFASFLTFSFFTIYFCMLFLLFAYIYSVPPWRIKVRPPLDSISAGLIYCYFPFCMGFSLVDHFANTPLHIYLFTFCVMGIHSYSTIADYSVDRCAGDRTFAVAFGKRAAAIFPAVAFLSTYFFLEIAHNRAFFAASTLFFISVAFYPSEKMAGFFLKFIYVGFLLSVSFTLGQKILL